MIKENKTYRYFYFKVTRGNFIVTFLYQGIISLTGLKFGPISNQEKQMFFSQFWWGKNPFKTKTSQLLSAIHK